MSTEIRIRMPAAFIAPNRQQSVGRVEIVEPFPPPTAEQLAGTWNVTHSSLPMWRKSRDVQITYSILPDGNILDLVTYYKLKGTKQETVKGVDKLSPQNGYTYNWRGKGWLVIASTEWEIVGWGEEEGGNRWAVTFFKKTLFTPAGIDIYSAAQEGLREETLTAIQTALANHECNEIQKMAAKMFKVRSDGLESTAATSTNGQVPATKEAAANTKTSPETQTGVNTQSAPITQPTET